MSELLNAITNEYLKQTMPKPKATDEEETNEAQPKPEPTQMEKLAKSTKNAFGG
jgi:hypothetical protein